MINIKWQSTLYKHHKQHSTTVYMYAVAASYKQIIVDFYGSERKWQKEIYILMLILKVWDTQ